jgi:nucleoside 2-deoxyribosyltransferase
MAYIVNPTCPCCDEKIPQSDGKKYDCRKCGSFEIVAEFDSFGLLNTRLKQNIGFWIRDQVELGERPRITKGVVKIVERLPEKTVIERAERLLRYGIAEQKDLGGRFDTSKERVHAITHSRSLSDFGALLGFLSQNEWLSGSYNMGSATISPKGFIHASESKPLESPNGFIAMWFDKSMASARHEGLEPAIRAAGYSPVIVSDGDHVNKIDDEIISQIRKARFLVADFTGHRGGVYFEAGFAMGRGLPVFWTCRANDVQNLHFDIRQYNCIDWSDPGDLMIRLKRRIEAVIGSGPVKTT